MNAFPNPELSIDMSFDRTNQYGMTLRDYFAAKAMQSILSYFLEPGLNYGSNPEIYNQASQASFACADSMIKQREQ